MREFELKWEKIADYTERLKVPGGWLVKFCKYQGDEIMIFVKDDHATNDSWKWDNEKR